MATPPLVCAADIANSLIERTYFDRCTLLITQDSSLINSMSFCNFSMDIDDFFTQHTRLKPMGAFLLDDAGLGNSFGEVSFLLIKVTYPSTFTSYADKYIDLKYLGNTYPIGELHIWTGTPGATGGRGVIISPGNSEFTSPYFSTGGIVIYNPHPNYVDLDIIIATKVTDNPNIDLDNTTDTQQGIISE